MATPAEGPECAYLHCLFLSPTRCVGRVFVVYPRTAEATVPVTAALADTSCLAVPGLPVTRSGSEPGAPGGRQGAVAILP